MRHTALILVAVATELSELAKANLPVLRKGEKVQSECFKNGILCRETDWNGQKFIAQFQFPQNTCKKCNTND